MQTAPAPGSFWDRLERDTTPKQRRANHAKVRSGMYKLARPYIVTLGSQDAAVSNHDAES